MLEEVKLVSDFRDQHYDFMFKSNGTKIYRRMSNEGPDKINQFYILAKMGFRIPPIGTVEYLYHTWPINTEEPEVVVYTDQLKHAGEGKILLPITKAYDLYPNFFASAYLRNDEPTTCRALFVGDHYITMKYSSDDAWRSNCGNVNIEETDISTYIAERTLLDAMYAPLTSVPIVAIDFVQYANEMWAIDLNTAPGISGTPATKYFDPVHIYETIRQNLFKRRPYEWKR